MTRDTTSDERGETSAANLPERTMHDIRLPARWRWSLLLVLVLVFMFGGDEPLWENPFAIDRGVWFSYLPIPLLVAAGLLWTKRFSGVGLFLNTLEITLTKFAITYVLAAALWAAFGKPEPPAPTVSHVPVAAPPAETAPEPTPWPTERRGNIAGTVTRAGEPVAEALVFVSDGLDDIVFPRPAEPRVISVGDSGFESKLIVVRRWQPLEGRSADGTLHTLFIESGEGSPRAIPLLPSGEPTTVALNGVSGVVPMRCSVHQHRAHLAVLHHGFHTLTDAQGRFRLEGVPSVSLTVAAWTERGEASASMALEAGAEPRVELALED